MPSLEDVKSERKAVKERVSDVEERIDYLKNQIRLDRKELHRAPAREQSEIYNRVQSRDRDLKLATNLLKQLTARHESLTARVREAKQAEGGVPIQFALLSWPERVRKLRRLSEIAEEE